MNKQTPLSRREFLKLGAVVVGTASVASLARVLQPLNALGQQPRADLDDFIQTQMQSAHLVCSPRSRCLNQLIDKTLSM